LLSIFRLEGELKDIDGVSQVQTFIPPEIPMQGTVVSVDEKYIEQNYDRFKDFIENTYFMTDQFLSDTGDTGVIVVTLDIGAPAGDVIREMRDISPGEGLSISLAGDAIIQDTLWHYLVRILCILPPCAIILVLTVFYVVLRNRRFTVLAIIPAGLAALWTFGTIFWSGQGLNLVTVLCPIFIIVMGSAYGLHYVSHFQDNLSRYSDRKELTVETMRMVGTPIFLATITTMAGFISLTLADVLPMRQMGIFVTVGIGYAGFLALFFLPAVLSRMKLPPRAAQTGGGRLVRFITAASKRRVPVMLVFAAIVCVSAVYIPRLEVVSDTLMFFKKGSEIRQTFSKVEESFGGALPLTGEIYAEGGTAALADYDYAQKVLATEREMEELPGVKSVFSVYDLVSGIYTMMTGQEGYPQNPMVVQMVAMQLGTEGLSSWVSDDGMRILVKTREFTSADIAEMNLFVKEHSNIVRVVTGMPVLFDEMNRMVVRSQVKSLGMALLLVFIMLLVTLRRVRAALAGLVPIVITIIAILGMISMTGFNLNVLTANLSAIAVGVGVDYAVHIISGIYYYRKEGQDRSESVDSALHSVTRPVLANALGLAIGMSVLFFSPLQIHLQAASVMWVAMVVSSMAALLIIPMLYSGRRPKEMEKLKM
jgi:predicted RND superfamily exporter protein